MLGVTPSFLRAAFLKAGMLPAKLDDDARCSAAPQLLPYKCT